MEYEQTYEMDLPQSSKEMERNDRGTSNQVVSGRSFTRTALISFVVILVANLALIAGSYVMVVQQQSQNKHEMELLKASLQDLSAGLNSSAELQTQKFQEELRVVEKRMNGSIYKSAKQISAETSSSDEKLGVSINNTNNQLAQTLLLAGWYRASDNYIYKRFPEKVTFQTAKAHCQSFGAHILSKGLRNVNVFRELLTTVLQPHHQVWTGYNDIESEGNWQWLDGGSTNPSVVQWYPGEPDSSTGNQDCSAILDVKNGQARFSDNSCTGAFLPYVCEQEFPLAF